MKLIEHYLDSLETYLPDEMKQDVRDELTASLMGQVEDSQEELGRELTSNEIEALLKKLGHPMQVASAYQAKQHLVGPDYFPAYRKALEIALALTVIVSIVLSVSTAFSGRSVIGVGINIFADILHSGLYVFALVTLVFYLMESYNADLSKIYAWSPKDLHFNSKRLGLSRLETGFELIASVLFIAWWNNVIPTTSYGWVSNETAKISLSAEWQSVFLSVNIIIALSIAIGVYKFVLATWDRFSLVSEILLSLATVVIIVQILQFDQFITLSAPLEENATLSKLIAHFDMVIYSILAIIAAISVWDIFSNTRKLRS